MVIKRRARRIARGISARSVSQAWLDSLSRFSWSCRRRRRRVFVSGSVFMPKLEVSRGSSVLLLPPPVFLVDLAEKHDAISAEAANENH